MEQKQIAIAENKQIYTGTILCFFIWYIWCIMLPSIFFSEHFFPFILLLSTEEAKKTLLLRIIVYAISFITNNIHIYLHYTFEIYCNSH